MKIDFNNMKNTCENYVALCNKLNEHINFEGRISICTDDIQGIMDDLRMNISIIAYQFIDVLDSMELPEFNPEGNSNE